MADSNEKNYHFKNLVFEGGGVKGIAYVGALEVLNKEGILKNIKRVAGTSAGAMVAVLVGLGYSPKEINDILWSLNFQNFLDDTFGYVRDVDRLINEYGWYQGDYFRNLMAGFIKDKTGNGEATFADLKAQKYRDIYLIGADLSTGFSKVFCFEHTQDVKVADAARISMSIPLFFRAVQNVNNDGHVYVDGGLLDNYPIKVFDRASYISEESNKRKTEYYEKTNRSLRRKSKDQIDDYVYNKETLGFRLDTKEEIEKFLDPDRELPIKNDIKTIFSYSKALVTTLIDFQNNVHLHSDDWQRTIYIDSKDVSSVDFGIPDSKKRLLVESGTTGTIEYLDWYNNDTPKANK